MEPWQDDPAPAAPDEEIPPGWLEPGAPPLILDIGCHRGSFLVDLAALRPEANILGIEKQAERVQRARGKVRRLGLTNAWALQSRGLETLRALPRGSVQAVHILFPDPWPKRKHATRRMVDTEFLEAVIGVLAPGGFLRFVTDDAPYADAVRRRAAKLPALIPDDSPGGDFPPSTFEQTFLEQQKPIHRLNWRRATV